MTLKNRGRSKKNDGRRGPKIKGGSLAVGTCPGGGASHWPKKVTHYANSNLNSNTHN